MVKKEKLISECDGLELDLTILVPDEGTRKGIVQFSHGMAEHSRRYMPFMDYLCEHGYVCVIHDHRGHGNSVKDKEERGFFYDLTGTYIVEDLHQVSVYVKERYPGLPLILFGHSMGSLVARCYIRDYDDELDRLILCGAPCNNVFVGAGIFAAKVLQKIKGGQYRSPFLHNLAMGMYSKAFEEEGVNAWICSDSSQVARYEQDEDCGFMFTVNGYRNLFLLLKNTFSKKGWRMQHSDLPIFFIAGEEDPVIGGRKKFKNSIRFLRDRGYSQINSHLYKGKRHELLNEDIRETVYRDILLWMEK